MVQIRSFFCITKYVALKIYIVDVDICRKIYEFKVI
jgi:hypothetical protein